MEAIEATYADLKIVKTRQVMQVILEVPLEKGKQVVDLLGIPDPSKEVWVAIAKLSAIKEGAEEKKSWNDLKPSQRCGIMCKDTEFQKWFTEKHGSFVAEDTKGAVEPFNDSIRDYLGIISRLLLDTHTGPAIIWNNLYAEYLADTRMPEVRG